MRSSNLARCSLSNVGSKHGTARLAMRPQDNVTDTVCPVPMYFLELAHRPFFHPFIFLLRLNCQTALLFGSTWHLCRKPHFAQQSLAAGFPASCSRKPTSILTRTQRYSTITADSSFSCVPVYDTCSTAPRHTADAHPCRSHLRLHSYGFMQWMAEGCARASCWADSISSPLHTPSVSRWTWPTLLFTLLTRTP